MDTVKLEKPQYIKIAEVRPGQHCFFIKGKLVSGERKEITRLSGDKVTVFEGVIADDSGCASIHLEGETAELASGFKNQTISIRNGRSEVVDEHIRLEVDKFGKVAKEDEVIAKPNQETNISAISYERKQADRRSRRP